MGIRSKFMFAAGAILAMTVGFPCLARAAPLAAPRPKPCRKKPITIAVIIIAAIIVAPITIVIITIAAIITAAITESLTLFCKNPGVTAKRLSPAKETPCG
jgi:hypothetical protein